MRMHAGTGDQISNSSIVAMEVVMNIKRKQLAGAVAGALVAFAATSAFADTPIVSTNVRPVTVNVGDGPGMQSILNTVMGCTGCVNATADQSSAAEWSIGGTGASIIPVLQFEFAGNASTNTFGIWSGTTAENLVTVQIFSGAATPFRNAAVQWDTDTQITILGGSGVNNGTFSGINKNDFGFYLGTSSYGNFYSADSLNGGAAQMISYRNSANGRWMLGFEDLPGNVTDHDYNDMVVSVESVTQAVPEPETYAMLLAGLGLMGFVARRRRGKDSILGMA